MSERKEKVIFEPGSCTERLSTLAGDAGRSVRRFEGNDEVKVKADVVVEVSRGLQKAREKRERDETARLSRIPAF